MNKPYSNPFEVADRSTSPNLLPDFWRQTSNSDEYIVYKLALREAFTKLPEGQQWLITQYYWKGKRKSKIAGELGVAPSTICKRIQKAEQALFEQIRFALDVYKSYKQYLEE